MGKYRRVLWGESFVAQRARKGLNQKECAKQIGIPLMTLMAIENGRALPSKWVAERMADVLGTNKEMFIESIIDEFEEQYREEK